jgi:hypothetical protein
VGVAVGGGEVGTAVGGGSVGAAVGSGVDVGAVVGIAVATMGAVGREVEIGCVVGTQATNNKDKGITRIKSFTCLISSPRFDTNRK